MTNVLVIEDEPDLNEALLALLSVMGYDPSGARTGVDGLAMAASREPDLVILDLGLPDVSGLEVLESLRRSTSAPVLVLSGTTRRHSRATALDAGADDFVQKPFDPGELSARLRAVLRRATSETESTQERRFGPIRVDVLGQRLFVDDAEVRLTSLEWRLLEALTRLPGQPLTHRWLITQVWNRHHGIEAQASLRTHVRALRHKLGDDAARPRYIRTENGIGYRWVAPTQPPESTAAPARAAHSWGTVRDSIDLALVELGHVLTGGGDRVRVTELGQRLQAARSLADDVDDVVLGGPAADSS